MQTYKELKNIYVRKQNDNVMRREGRDSFTVLAFENVCKNFV